MQERVKDYCDGIAQSNENARKAAPKGSTPTLQKPDEGRMRDLMEEEWYLWVKGLVRVKVGKMGGGDVSRGKGSIRITGTMYLQKPAVFDPMIDMDMGTDDVERVEG